MTPTPVPAVADTPAATPTATASTAADTPTATPTVTSPVPTNTPLPPTATTTSEPRCTVQTAALNLRSGPGTVYDPPVASLPQGTELEPLAFSPIGFPDSQWMMVRVRRDGQMGWVSTSSQLVFCTIDPASLPPGAPPPTPTPIATPTFTPAPTPTATPTRVLLAFVPVDGGSYKAHLRNNYPIKDGRNIILPGFAQSEVTEPMVFRDRIVFRVEIFDTYEGNEDGKGIEQVEFTIAENGEVVHERTERRAGYCVFGGGEPDCNVWVYAEHDNKWPSGERLREDVLYNVTIHIVAESGDTSDWVWSFQVDLPE